MCCASAADPPLPKMSSLPSDLKRRRNHLSRALNIIGMSIEKSSLDSRASCYD